MKTFFTCLLTLTIALCHAQDFAYPSIKQNGSTFKDFLPDNWTILDSAKGDLNKDGVADAVVVLEHTDRVKLPKDTDKTDDAAVKDSATVQHRILIILFRNQKDRKYHLAAQSNSFIVSASDAQFTDGPPLMEDPYQEMKIESGILQINFGTSYSMGSWYITNTSYKFRYQGGHFVLIGANYYSSHRATNEFEDYSFNLLTHKRKLVKGNDSKKAKKTYWKDIDNHELKTLESFKAPFTWQVEPDLYL